MLTTIVLLSAFLAIAASLLKLMLAVESRDRDHLALLETTSRLSRVFRDDVHEARGAIAFPAGLGVPAELVLEMPDGRTVRYEAGVKSLLRVEGFSGFPIHGDAFDLRGHIARFSVEKSGEATLVGIVYDRRKAPLREDARPIRIEAGLGLDERFRHPATGKGR